MFIVTQMSTVTMADMVNIKQLGLHSGTKKIRKLSKYIENLSKNSVIFWIGVKPSNNNVSIQEK